MMDGVTPCRTTLIPLNIDDKNRHPAVIVATCMKIFVLWQCQLPAILTQLEAVPTLTGIESCSEIFSVTLATTEVAFATCEAMTLVAFSSIVSRISGNPRLKILLSYYTALATSPGLKTGLPSAQRFRSCGRCY